jgi:hypothetical protein
MDEREDIKGLQEIINANEELIQKIVKYNEKHYHHRTSFVENILRRSIGLNLKYAMDNLNGTKAESKIEY